MNLCEFPECGRPLHGKGLCVQHLKQQREGKGLKPIRPKATGKAAKEVMMTLEQARTAWAEAQAASHEASTAVQEAKDKLREAERHLQLLRDAERLAWVAMRDSQLPNKFVA